MRSCPVVIWRFHSLVGIRPRELSSQCAWGIAWSARPAALLGFALAAAMAAGVVAVRRAGAIHVFDSISHYFMISEMIVPGSSYWNIGIGREIVIGVGVIEVGGPQQCLFGEQ